MSWYPPDGVIVLVRNIVQQKPLDVRDTACFSWQWDASQQLFNIPTQHWQSRIGIGLCQGLDWREVMNWYSIDGATSTTKDRSQLEPWDTSADDWPWRHWDPGGSVDGRTCQSLIWDLGIKVPFSCFPYGVVRMDFHGWR